MTSFRLPGGLVVLKGLGLARGRETARLECSPNEHCRRPGIERPTPPRGLRTTHRPADNGISRLRGDARLALRAKDGRHDRRRGDASGSATGPWARGRWTNREAGRDARTAASGAGGCPAGAALEYAERRPESGSLGVRSNPNQLRVQPLASIRFRRLHPVAADSLPVRVVRVEGRSSRPPSGRGS